MYILLALDRPRISSRLLLECPQRLTLSWNKGNGNTNGNRIAYRLSQNIASFRYTESHPSNNLIPPVIVGLIKEHSQRTTRLNKRLPTFQGTFHKPCTENCKTIIL